MTVRIAYNQVDYFHSACSMPVYTIGEHTFHTKVAAKKFIRQYMADHVGRVSDDDMKKIVLPLFEQHHRWPQLCFSKTGEKYDHVKVEPEPQTPGTYRFKMVFRSGDPDIISFHKCIDGKKLAASHRRQKVYAAMRNAIADQISDFRKASFQTPSKIPICAISKRKLQNDQTTHVDHVYPNTFKHIADSFMEWYGVKWENVGVVDGVYPNPQNHTLEDNDTKRAFADYHQQHAQMRLVSNTSHLRLKHHRLTGSPCNLYLE